MSTCKVSLTIVSLMPFLLLFFAASSVSSIEFKFHCIAPHRPLRLPITPAHHTADCRFLLAHLPSDLWFARGNPTSLSSSTASWRYGDLTPVSVSLPFLPRAHLRHSSCELQINWFPNESPSSPFWNHQHTTSWQLGPPVVKYWSLGTSLGKELVTRCVERGLAGVGVASIDWVRVHVLVGVLDRQESWDRRQDTLKGFLAGLEEPQEDDLNLAIHDPWSYGIYEV